MVPGALGYGGMRTGWLGWVVLVSAALIAGIPHSFADEIAPTGEYKEGLPAGGWMLFPSVFVGAVYNDNLGQSAQGTPLENAFGVRAVPRLVGTYDGGIYKTTVYGVVDGDFYHDNASNSNFFDNNTLSASAGFAQPYQPMRDLVFNFYGNYTRERDIFNSALNFNNGAIGPAGYPSEQHPDHHQSVWNDAERQSHCLQSVHRWRFGYENVRPRLRDSRCDRFLYSVRRVTRQCTGSVPDLP